MSQPQKKHKVSYMRERSLGNAIFIGFNYFFLFVAALICFLPFLQVVASSFTTNQELIKNNFVLIPHTYSLEAYRFIFSSNVIPRSLIITVLITIIGTFINLLFTSMTAFGLARRELYGRRLFMFLIVFTMLFSGGLIPTYLVVKQLHMLNSYWAVLLPDAISAFNLILMRNFFMSLPEEMFDSARMDGCNDLSIYFRIALPLSKAALATFTLFYAVGHWNDFMQPFLYLNDYKMWPIQIWLRQIIVLATGNFSDYVPKNVVIPTKSLQMAMIVVASLPIMLVYPFLQQYFTKGVLLGSVKG